LFHNPKQVKQRIILHKLQNLEGKLFIIHSLLQNK